MEAEKNKLLVRKVSKINLLVTAVIILTVYTCLGCIMIYWQMPIIPDWLFTFVFISPFVSFCLVNLLGFLAIYSILFSVPSPAKRRLLTTVIAAAAVNALAMVWFLIFFLPGFMNFLTM